jgi:hypothetical protein
MAAPVAWVLNLDADLELGSDPNYEPRKSVLRAMQPHLARLAESLLGAADLVVDSASVPGCAAGFVGRAFCPTPRALRILQRAGATPEAHPGVEVLRRANSRAFASSLGPTLPDAAFVTDPAIAGSILDRAPAIGAAWRVKHAFGMTGRNQRVIAVSSTDESDGAFVRAGLARGGVQIEPNIAIESEYAIHGLLAPDRTLRVGRLVRQYCDARGAWQRTERASDAACREIGDRMTAEADRVGRALARIGFFGPFGVDAYRYRDSKNALALQPRSEINARYCMGFAVGFAMRGD